MFLLFPCSFLIVFLAEIVKPNFMLIGYLLWRGIEDGGVYLLDGLLNKVRWVYPSPTMRHVAGSSHKPFSIRLSSRVADNKNNA